ncbi:MAG: hypothetical protein Q7K54_02275 [Candidatus Parcubacteria bacterium]|nr:hypothetical protein [Candidatus Parcubacteria bacterium]
MKNNWQIKKLGGVIIGFIFVIMATFLFSRNEYDWGVVLMLSLLILYKADALTELAFSFSDGIRAKFQTSPEKIEENIKENKEPITNENYASFRNIETKILSELQKRYDGEMKTLVHFVYGQPDKPEFLYTPDGSLQTKDALYFFEIKYILKPELAKNIVSNTLEYLNNVYTKLSPSIGDKRFVIKLILASGYDLSKMSFDVPVGIELEFFKV